MSTATRIALVLPVYNEADLLPELFSRLTTLFDGQPQHVWKAILVDDGSIDQSAAMIGTQRDRDPRFQLVRLSRNFGFQAALTAGLANASEADAVVTMDSDLQDPPELIPQLIVAWTQGADVVLAKRISRKERGIRRLGFDLFHRFFRSLSDFNVEPNTGTFGLLSRSAVTALSHLPERHRFFPGLRSWVGFETAEIQYERQLRSAGSPKQSFSRLVSYAFDGLFSFSYLPLRALTYAGVLISSVGFFLGLYFVIKRLIGVETAGTGFTTLVTLLLFIGGVQLIGIGILGEYLGRIYDEVKQRPLYILKESAPPRV